MSALPTPPISEIIGGLRVIRKLACGGTATVYEVEEPEGGRRLALKLLDRPGLAAERFAREYRALCRLDHENVLRVHRYGQTDDGRPFMTMELLHGVPSAPEPDGHDRPASRPTAPAHRASHSDGGRR